MPYPKFDWSPFHLPAHWYKRYRYACGKCGFDSVVMKLTAERHYYRCQHGGKAFWPKGSKYED